MTFVLFLIVAIVAYSLQSSTLQFVQARESNSLNYEHLFVFGDSMTDNGISADSFPSHGFGRWSNGPVWADYLAQELNIEHYENRAYAGATSSYSSQLGYDWSGMMWQVDHFISTYPSIPEGSLIAIQFCGAIDFFAGINKTVEIAQNSLKAIEKLVKHGAIDILALNPVMFESAPGVRNDPIMKLNMTVLVTETNRRINELLFHPITGVSMRYPKLNFQLFDFMGAVNDLALTFRNHTVYITHVRDDFRVEDTYHFAFYDPWHPTTFLHFKVAQRMIETLQRFN